LKDLFETNKTREEDEESQGVMRTAVQCAVEGASQRQCGVGDISRITSPATIMVRASEKGPEIVAEDLYTIPSGLIPPTAKKRRVIIKDDKVTKHDKTKKTPTVSSLIIII
jgi:hypothetical protein